MPKQVRRLKVVTYHNGITAIATSCLEEILLFDRILDCSLATR
jgi:hypothetical protein